MMRHAVFAAAAVALLAGSVVAHADQANVELFKSKLRRGLPNPLPVAGQVVNQAAPARPPSSPAGPQPQSVAGPAEAPSADANVQFANGSAQLTAAAMSVLDDLGQALIDPSLAPDRFLIEGHTDTVGDRGMNQSLSERRAAAVVSYLARKYRIPTQRLVARGMGKDGLLVPTPDQTPEPRNRRVHVVNLGS